jgi:catechol-2,3-dioxygenase
MQFGNALQDISGWFGLQFKKLRLLWLSSNNNIGFEIFQFINPKSVEDSKQSEYRSSGMIHISITEPNVEDLVKKVTETGGKKVSKIWELNQEKNHRLVFYEDPFGNIIETYSHSYEQIHANV